MNMINSLVLEGEILADAELKESLHGSFTEIVISVKRFYKNAAGEKVEEESRFAVQAFGTIADFLTGNNGHTKHGLKGQEVRIVGRLKQEYYSCDGRRCARVIVVAEHIEFKPAFKKTGDKSSF